MYKKVFLTFELDEKISYENNLVPFFLSARNEKSL